MKSLSHVRLFVLPPLQESLLEAAVAECTKTQEKGAVTPQETDPDMPVSVQESPAEAWVSGGQLQD